MTKSAHRPAQRVILPNRMWLLIYEPDEDGHQLVKLAGYGRTVQVTEVLNRNGGAHVFTLVSPAQPGRDKTPRPRGDDLVTVDHEAYAAMRRFGLPS